MVKGLNVNLLIGAFVLVAIALIVGILVNVLASSALAVFWSTLATLATLGFLLCNVARRGA